MKRPRMLALLLALLLALPSGVDAQTLFSIASADDQLRVVDPLTALTLSSTSITLAGNTVDGGTGLAVDPTTGTFWALLNINGTGGGVGGGVRQLVTLDPTTGVATLIGNTGSNFAGIAFSSTGTLFGVTGNVPVGGLLAESLYTLSKTTAAPSLFQQLGNGTDGETMAFNPVDGLMYHASGHSGVGSVIFETIDLSNNNVTDIPIGAPLTDEEAQALTWWGAQGVFLWKQNHGEGPLFSVTSTGAATLIGDLDHQAKGLAFSIAAVPEPTTVTLMISGLTGLGGAYWFRRRRATKAL